jgi:hypothetical protein
VLGSTRVSFKLFAPLAVAAIALLGLLPAGAAAAVQYGSDCVASEPAPFHFSAQIQRDPDGGQPVATTAAGVITKWTVRSGNQNSTEEKLKVLRPVGAGFEAIAESSLKPVIKGATNEFATRIPVPAGAIFGAYVTTNQGPPRCIQGVGLEDDVLVSQEEDPPLNQTRTPNFKSLGFVLALQVTVEPDGDGDGYGDETQDQCPTNAAVQTACPTTAPGTGGGSSGGGNTSPSMPTTLSITAAKLEGNTVAVKLSSTVQTQVSLTASIRGKSAGAAAKVNVIPGEIARGYVSLSKATLERLAKLPRKQHLNLLVQAQVPGAPSASRELPLPGRKKSHRKHHGGR